MSSSNPPDKDKSTEKPSNMTHAEELEKYVSTLQSDVTKLQIQVIKSEDTIKKLQELNATYCKVPPHDEFA